MKIFLSLAVLGLFQLSLAAQSAEHYYQDGSFYFDAADYPRAIDRWQAGTRVDPGAPRLWFNLALAQLELDRHAEAAASLRTLLTITPDDVQAHLLLGSAYEGMGQYLYAADAFTESYRLRPEAATLLLRGSVYHKADEYELAELDYRTVLEEDPEHPVAHAGLGDVAAARQDWQQAIYHYDDALSLDPEDALTLYRRGRAKMEVGYYDTAIFDLSNAIALDPYVDHYYAGRALCRLEIADPYGADIDARRARRYNPDNADAWFALGKLATQEDDYYAAANGFNMALQIQDDNARYRYARGRFYHSIAAYLPAAKDFRVASALDPELEEIDKWIARAEGAHRAATATLAAVPATPKEEELHPAPATAAAPTWTSPARRAVPAEREGGAIDGWMLQPEE